MCFNPGATMENALFGGLDAYVSHWICRDSDFSPQSVTIFSRCVLQYCVCADLEVYEAMKPGNGKLCEGSCLSVPRKLTNRLPLDFVCDCTEIVNILRHVSE